MKLNLAASFLLLASASAFTVVPRHGAAATKYTNSAVTSSLSSPVLMAATETPQEAPPLSPKTLWGESISDIRKLQEEMRRQELPEFAPTISSKDVGLARDDTEGQIQYFKENAMDLKQKMQNHGAVIFRDFDLMKTQEGFQQFYGALGMKVCLDPLHSVSARPTVDGQKNSPVYEAVNKESRKNFFIGAYDIAGHANQWPSVVTAFIGFLLLKGSKSSSSGSSLTLTTSLFLIFSNAGMHNEFVGSRAPRAAAFVCFKAAETGGEFLVADGRRMFRDMDSDLVEELYNRQIRYSVMELPFFGWIDNLPSPLQQPIMGVMKGLVSAAINAKVDFDVELLWGEGGYDNTKMLQARAPSQPPIVVHPVTGDPTWFCNVHSHSSKLRKDREAM